MPTPVTPRLYERVKELVSQGCAAPEISKLTGLSRAIVCQIRQGRYDTRPLRQRFPNASAEVLAATERQDSNEEPVIVWCTHCNCHVSLPCQLCLAKAYQRDIQKYPGRRRQPAALPENIDDQTRRKLCKNVAEIGLAIRLVHTLQDASIQTVNDLLHSTPGELLNLPCVGNVGLQRIYRALAKLGFHRRQSDQGQAKP